MLILAVYIFLGNTHMAQRSGFHILAAHSLDPRSAIVFARRDMVKRE